MSRIGKKPVTIKEQAIIEIKDSQIVIKGPKGELNFDISPMLEIKTEDSQLIVERKKDNKHIKSRTIFTR